MAESTQRSDVTGQQADARGQQADATGQRSATAHRPQSPSPTRDPRLQPLDPKPVRPVHHGQTGAMWTASVLALVGFLVGAVGVLMNVNWVLFTIGAVLCLIALVSGFVLQKLGFGIYQKR